ncbi:type II toxin-antitoxin system HicA family toxin [Acidithiobacillus caldus]|jgi:mRNA interferase HicA|uniref:type II toxin-antitoxin system HicA family toxin n=1 Tax=Acidithiobacillus caldus TaxID=33059 RepID=UPI001C075AAA|nr:type II toxin-antitoxin system HicA family toxin [Acidithiobacillus caldus]MBU2763766.1 type II toxin-antitoxin system HicA family toxin [Acidithiobacillus caldus]MBU2772084.1 type II toxin-antitoxin system HicA family toxin [Acidithiobacillus caldus]MBU2782343.1 type II toxin-antitoxin system HicA family toxin [Acidithiobacillus caldus]
MTGADFIEKVHRIGKARGIGVRFDPRPGKGSHGRLYYGDRFTTVKDRRKEIGAGLLNSMLKQLGLTLEDIR